MFCIFLFIFCEVANHFVAVRKNLVVEGLNIMNLYAIYDPVTGPEQPIYVVLCVAYKRKGAKIRNQYNQVSHLAQYTKWESNNYTI